MAIITMPSDFPLRDIFLWLSECRKFCSAIFPCTNGSVLLVVVVVPPPPPTVTFVLMVRPYDNFFLGIETFFDLQTQAKRKQRERGKCSFYPTPNLDKESMLL